MDDGYPPKKNLANTGSRRQGPELEKLEDNPKNSGPCA
jgi:hypothetical protein